MSVTTNFNVRLLVRNEHGRMEGDCYALSICQDSANDILAENVLAQFTSAYFDCPFCTFRVNPPRGPTRGHIVIGGHRIQVYAYCTWGSMWDRASMDYRSVTRLWRILMTQFWGKLCLESADSFLYRKWERQEMVDFKLFDYRSAFWDQMYTLCGERREHGR